MRISERFKKACLKAKEKGYTRVYSHAAQKFYTIYVSHWPIEYLTGLENGTVLSAYQGGPYRLYPTLREVHNIEGKAIQYRDLMYQFG